MIHANGTSHKEGIISDLLPDLTPLIDVMFMLIIFLILTTNVQLNIFDIELPVDDENATTIISDPNPLNITIHSESLTWSIDKESFDSFTNFKEALTVMHETDPERPIVILGDKNVTIDKLFDVLTFMRTRNIPAADIVMDRQSK